MEGCRMSAEWLAKCVDAAARNPVYVMQWARIRGIELPETPMDWLVDDSTGRADSIAALFIEDVRELIYDRLPAPEDA
jgi:hypothetical protein